MYVACLSSHDSTALRSCSPLRKLRSVPKQFCREVCALPQRLEFLPDDCGVNLGAVERLRRKSAVCPGHDVFAADELGKAHNAFGNQLRMLDDVAGMRNDARAEHLA